MTQTHGGTMLNSKTTLAAMAVILTYSLTSQALLGNLLPGKGNQQQAPQQVDQKQDEEDRPFFDNRKNHQKPDKTKPAPAKVIMQKPNYQGNGCPQGTAAVTMSGDNRAVSIVFDNFTTEAGQQAMKQSNEKTCRLIIPIEAPKGFRMAVAQLDYRGFHSLPAKAKARLTAIHQIRHQALKVLGTRERSQQTFEGPLSQDFFMSAVIESKPVVNIKSPLGGGLLGQAVNPLLNPILKTCGGTYNLEVDVSIAVMTNATGEQAMITLDTIDGQVSDKNSVSYHLQWEQCQ